ncbi:MAG: hypothetical protein KDJ38_11145 [Gammaproteobacteria bacterium]|nr:hypothetical protein [Gammaproteobacteria bacterium]
MSEYEHMKDRPADVTPELLMAYADGALDADEMARLADIVNANPELQNEVAVYTESRQALGQAFDQMLDEPVPDHLMALLQDKPDSAQTGAADSADKVVSLQAAREKRAGGLIRSGWGQAIAASVMLALGALIGTNLTKTGPDGVIDPHELVYAGLIGLETPLGKALETAPSAEVLTLEGGVFSAIQTFSTGQGVLCREYEAGHSGNGVVGVACRTEAGWRVEILLADTTPAGTAGSDYQPASGMDSAALDQVLTGLGALPGLDQGKEACLLEHGWSAERCGIPSAGSL